MMISSVDSVIVPRSELWAHAICKSDVGGKPFLLYNTVVTDCTKSVMV